MHKVSFILPAYKRRFLKEAIDSILAQTCREYELVVVDDKSPEGLYEVIKEYAWEKKGKSLPDGGKKWLVDGVSVRYYQNTENIGGRDLVAAWNHAMEYATGEWCVLASDDDIYFPGYLAEMLRLASKYPKCDLVHARLAVIGPEGKWKNVAEERVEFETQIQLTYARAALRVRQYAPDFMFRLAAWKEMGGFVIFPRAWYTDDATWMKLSNNGVACSSEILFGFRSSGENISTRFDDVEEKIVAGEQFREWFADFYRKLVPISAEDEFMLDRMGSTANSQINRLSESELSHIKWAGKFLRLLWTMKIPIREKLGIISRRYPILSPFKGLVKLVVDGAK